MPEYSDFKFLPSELQNTPIGKRYEHACLILRVTAMEVNVMFGYLRLGEITRDLAEPRIHYFRRRYITYSDLASSALDELTKTYDWPCESVADESFTWPPVPVPPKVAPTPAAPIPTRSFEVQALELILQGYRLTKVVVPPKSSH
jgi:hypothetical protein